MRSKVTLIRSVSEGSKSQSLADASGYDPVPSRVSFSVARSITSLTTMLRNEVPTGLIVEFASRAIHRMPTRKSPTAVQPVYEYCVNASFENKLPDWG